MTGVAEHRHRMNKSIYGDPGFLICGSQSRAADDWTLRTIFGVPAAVRSSILFGHSRVCDLAQRATQRLLGGPRATCIQYTEGPVKGSRFNCFTSEKYFLLGTKYEMEIRAMASRLCGPGTVAYEIGAHAGYWALFLSRICSGKGRVFAFEPSKQNFQRLLDNLRLNVTSNVTPINRAVSEMEGTLPFEEAGSRSKVIREGSRPDGTFTTVASMRLDDFVFREVHPLPALILMDVEGHGGKVLRGAKCVLRWGKPNILCEIHDSVEEKEIVAELKAAGYTTKTLSFARSYPKHVLCAPRAVNQARVRERTIRPRLATVSCAFA